MTREQYERWKDFATRMARVCFKGQRRPGPRHVQQCVADFFAMLDAEDVPCIVSWDHSSPYPEGSRHHRALGTFTCGCQYRHGYAGARCEPDPDCKSCGGTGTATRYARPRCVGDMCSDWKEHWIPNYWSIPDEKYEDASDRWAGPAMSCIRAGLDLASTPSAGVIGFTAGDIRRMYPEGVPSWISDGWENAEVISASAIVPGVGFIPQVVGKSEAFADMADETPLWL